MNLRLPVGREIVCHLGVDSFAAQLVLKPRVFSVVPGKLRFRMKFARGPRCVFFETTPLYVDDRQMINRS